MSCTPTLNDLGTPSCPSVMDVTKLFVIVPELDDSGAKNVLTLANAKLLANWVAKFDAAATKDRFYPTLPFENVTEERGDPEVETFSSGRIAKLRNGQRSFEGFMIDGDTIYLGKLEDWDKTKMGVYIIDKAGNIIYKKCDGSTDLNPIMIDEQSFNTKLVKKGDDAIEKIQVNFNFRQTEKDSELRILLLADLDFDPLTDFFALLDVESTHSAITTTTFTTTLVDGYGNAVENLVLGDFALAELTPTPATITISSVTESAAGVYDFVIPAESSADVLELTPTKSGYDFVAVVADTITIP